MAAWNTQKGLECLDSNFCRPLLVMVMVEILDLYWHLGRMIFHYFSTSCPIVAQVRRHEHLAYCMLARSKSSEFGTTDLAQQEKYWDA